MNSGFLETAIGLVLVYMILSFLCTGINEWVATMTQRRAAFLEKGIMRLLGPDLAQRLQDHPLVQALRKTSTSRGRPSYIPDHTFSRVVMSILPRLGPAPAPGSSPSIGAMIENIDQEQARKALLTLWNDAKKDADAFKRSIEEWFDDTMDRVSGWYKRRTLIVSFVVAVGVAFTLNADTVRIATTLWTNPTVRSALTAQAEQAVQQQQPAVTATAPPAPSTPTVKESLQEIKALPLPFGWTSASKTGDPRAFPNSFAAALVKLLGLLITAVALTMGAPFWFDLLKRFVGIRAAGSTPDKVAR